MVESRERVDGFFVALGESGSSGRGSGTPTRGSLALKVRAVSCFLRPRHHSLWSRPRRYSRLCLNGVRNRARSCEAGLYIGPRLDVAISTSPPGSSEATAFHFYGSITRRIAPLFIQKRWSARSDSQEARSGTFSLALLISLFLVSLAGRIVLLGETHAIDKAGFPRIPSRRLVQGIELVLSATSAPMSRSDA